MASEQTPDYGGGYGEGQPFMCAECETAPAMQGFTVCQECWDERARRDPPWASEMEELHHGQ